MYLLRAYDLELTRVGGTGDQGIDGIGIAPISPVLSSRSPYRQSATIPHLHRQGRCRPIPARRSGSGR